MSTFLMNLMRPLANKFATDFLYEKNVTGKLDKLLKNKLKKSSNRTIGANLGLSKESTIDDAPLSGYDYYYPFFNDPKPEYFMYPLNDYIVSQTSGTAGKPKSYLLPVSGIKENIKRTGPSIFTISSYDGDDFAFKFGDTMYMNIPGGTFISSFIVDISKKSQSNLLKMVPENRLTMSYQEKVDYFIDHHEEIDIAYMTVPALLDEVKSNVEGPISLKTFLTLSTSASPMKETIKDFCGVYPSVTFGSTETILCTVPSPGNPGGFFFDWRVIYPEFIPEDMAVDNHMGLNHEVPDMVPLMEVEKGKRYQLVATPFYNDLVRYVMPDIFECVSLSDDVLGSGLPVFKYYARSDRLLVLDNFTRINEEELVQVLTNAKIPFVDFTVQKELVGNKDHMVIYVELSEPMAESEIIQKVHDVFVDFDKDYRDLSDFMKYVPIKVHILPRGSFSNYQKNKGGQPKLERIGMRPKRLQSLLGNS